MLKQCCKASLVDCASRCNQAVFIHLAKAMPRDPVIDRRIRGTCIKREKPAVTVTPGYVPHTAKIDDCH